MAKIAIMIGTPSGTSRLHAIVDAAEESLRGSGVLTKRIHVASLPAEDLIRARFDSPDIIRANDLVEQADAVIVASPVYKASYSGVLKTYLDLLPQKGLTGKVVLPLFIGGSIAHLLAVDYALKPVLSALGARHILGGVYAVDQWVSKDGEGAARLSEELSQRLSEAVRELASELHWRAIREQSITSV